MERAPLRSLLSVTDDIIGAQAQLYSAAQIALWARVCDLHVEQVDAAIEKRTLVKAAGMRRTLFLVPSKHLAVFVRGSARRAEKEIRWARGKGIPDRVLEAAIAATLDTLDEPRTRPEIAERVSQKLGVQKQHIHGGGWGRRTKVAAVPIGHLTFPIVYLLHLVAARGVICYGPYRANEPTFVRADAWVPKWQDLPREEAESRLLHKYLQAFGPATVADFSMWVGILLTEAREIWAREQTKFATVNVEGWTASLLKADVDQLLNTEFDGTHVRLLPYFDTFLLGHRDRQHLVPPQQQPKVFRPQGWIAPVVLVNGQVAGVWKHTPIKNSLLVQVEKFESISRSITSRIREEAQDLARFLDIAEMEIQFR